MKPDDSDKILSGLFKKRRSEIFHDMPPMLKKQILSGFETELKDRSSFFLWMSFGGGAIAVCAALVMSFQFGKISSTGTGGQVVLEEVVSSHVRSLMINHLSDVVSTDQHTVKPWFEGKIDFAPTVKDFAKFGYPLVGGRLDYIDSRPTAALIYKFKQHVVNLLEHPSHLGDSFEPHLQTLRGYQIFSWTKDGMSYWVISDLNASDLQKFVYLWQ